MRLRDTEGLASQYPRMSVLQAEVVMREETEVEILSYRAFCERQTLEAWRRRHREYQRARDRGEPAAGDRYRGREAAQQHFAGRP